VNSAFVTLYFLVIKYGNSWRRLVVSEYRLYGYPRRDILLLYNFVLYWTRLLVQHLNKQEPIYYILCLTLHSGPGSSVGITTGYGLDGPGIESRWWGRFSAPVQTGPGAHPASCTMGTGSFPGVKSGQGVTLTPHPLLVPRSWKGRAIPLLPLWAVRPVQSLSACTGVHFTFTF
jgi:hypothetical protein